MQMRIYLRHRFVNLFSLCTLLRNSIGGVVRDVWHCSGMGRQHVLATGSLAPSCGCAAQRLALRETLLPRPPDDARSALPILAPACVLRGKRRSRTPCPPPCRITMRHGGVASSLRSRLWRSRLLSTPCYERAISACMKKGMRPAGPCGCGFMPIFVVAVQGERASSGA